MNRANEIVETKSGPVVQTRMYPIEFHICLMLQSSSVFRASAAFPRYLEVHAKNLMTRIAEMISFMT